METILILTRFAQHLKSKLVQNHPNNALQCTFFKLVSFCKRHVF